MVFNKNKCYYFILRRQTLNKPSEKCIKYLSIFTSVQNHLPERSESFCQLPTEQTFHGLA